MDSGILTRSQTSLSSVSRHASLQRLDQYASIVAQIIDRLEPLHVLDYGCGPNLDLAQALHRCGVTHNFKLQAYDPDIPKYSGDPVSADVVVCLDLLNTSDDEAVVERLDHLSELVEGAGFFVLEDRPAHWWLPKIMKRFDLQTFQRMPGGAYVIVYGIPKGVIEGTDGAKLT